MKLKKFLETLSVHDRTVVIVEKQDDSDTGYTELLRWEFTFTKSCSNQKLKNLFPSWLLNAKIIDFHLLADGDWGTGTKFGGRCLDIFVEDIELPLNVKDLPITNISANDARYKFNE